MTEIVDLRGKNPFYCALYSATLILIQKITIISNLSFIDIISGRKYIHYGRKGTKIVFLTWIDYFFLSEGTSRRVE